MAADGVYVGRKRVARLMRDAGVQGVSRRKRHRTTRRDPAAPAPDLVGRDFAAVGPDRLLAVLASVGLFVGRGR